MSERPFSWNEAIAPGRGQVRVVGSRRLWVEACPKEVKVLADGGTEPDVVTTEAGFMDEPPGQPFRFSHAGHTVVFGLRCADRPFVVRPAMRLTLLPQASCRFYVTTPVWLTLSREERDPFFEVPAIEPKSTWFGATPQAGELAYASRTLARPLLDLHGIHPGRIATRVTLRNPLDSVWCVERLKVPTPHLSAWQGAQRLWTPSITIRNVADGEVDMGIDTEPPDEAGACRQLAPAREGGTPKLLVRALGSMGWRG